MIWRMRAPRTVLLISGIGAILLPLDPIGPSIALTWVLAKSPKKDLFWAVPFGFLSIALPLWRDFQYGAAGAVLAGGRADTLREQFDFGSYLVVGFALAIGSLSIGLAKRWAQAAAIATDQARASSETATRLAGTISRQEERELIAREMHDTVAHHLSLVSLHAAALEVTSTDPQVPPATRAVRDNAHQALEEMRTLIHSLRDSEGGGYEGAAPSINDIHLLVEGIREVGVEVATELQIPEGDQAVPPALGRAAYRIVQESLTNCRRHSPQSGIGLEVIVLTGQGVSISVSNWLSVSKFAPARSGALNPGEVAPQARPAATGLGAGAGLLGMRERAKALGGRLEAGPEGDRWVVRAWLPWEVR